MKLPALGTALVVLATACATASNTAHPSVAPPAPASPPDYRVAVDRFQRLTRIELPMEPVDGVSLAHHPEDQLWFGATIVVSDTAPSHPRGVVHFWAIKPVDTRFEPYFYLNRTVVILADSARIEAGRNLFFDTNWGTETRVAQNRDIDKAAVNIPVEDLRRIALAQHVEGQVGAAFNFAFRARQLEALRGLLAKGDSVAAAVGRRRAAAADSRSSGG